MAIPTPVIMDDVGISIGKTDQALDLIDLSCSGNHVELTPDTALTTLDTFCGSVDYPGNTKWSLVATFYQSFDVGAVEEVLSAAVAFGGPVLYEITPFKSQAVGPTNPTFSGMCVPQPYAPINGDAGDASTVEIEWALTAPPTKAVALAAREGASGTSKK